MEKMHEDYIKPSLAIQDFLAESYFMVPVSLVTMYPQVDEYSTEEEQELEL